MKIGVAAQDREVNGYEWSMTYAIHRQRMHVSNSNNYRVLHIAFTQSIMGQL